MHMPACLVGEAQDLQAANALPECLRSGAAAGLLGQVLAPALLKISAFAGDTV